MEKETTYKYIVYKTINLQNDFMYIGIHKTEDLDQFDRFIGNGVFSHIPYTYQHSKTAFQAAVKQYGSRCFKRMTLKVCDTEDEARVLKNELLTENFLSRCDIYNLFSWRIQNDNEWRPIHRYFKNGKFDKSYENVLDASQDTNCSRFEITESALVGNCILNKYYFCFVKNESYDKARCTHIKNRPVFQYEGSTGEYLKSYRTQTEAEKDNKYSNISKSIKLKTVDKNGFIWSLEKFEIFNKPKEKQKSKRVGKFDLNGDLVEEYRTITSAVHENSKKVWQVLHGKISHHKGYIYKYIK